MYKKMVITHIKKVWLFLGYLILARKTWRWPRQSEVLILDAMDHEALLAYLQPWHPEELHVRGEQINMRVLLNRLFKNSRRWNAYTDCFIEKVRPRLIITFTDNYSGFYLLAERHPGTKTIFVQNGIRISELFETLDSIVPSEGSRKVDYMMTFGSRIGAEYARHIQGTVVPMGSIKNNSVPKRRTKKAGTIAFVSQYRDTKGCVVGGKFYSRRELFERADELLLTFLLEYAENHRKELFIVPCSGYYKDNTLKKEQEYYNKLAGQTCSFSEWSWDGSSYDAVDSAEVVVGIDSTLVYESAARGNKTAFFSIRSQLMGTTDRNYGWPEIYPDTGPYWTNLPDPAVFERIMDHLFAINDEQWRAELSEHGFANIMAYDPGNTILQSVFQKELGSAPILKD